MIASPCTQICDINAATGLCRGCLRTLAEIAAWASMTDEQQARLFHALQTRRALPG